MSKYKLEYYKNYRRQEKEFDVLEELLEFLDDMENVTGGYGNTISGPCLYLKRHYSSEEREVYWRDYLEERYVYADRDGIRDRIIQ